MVAVIAQLMLYKQQDQNTDGHAHRQAKNIDPDVKGLLLGRAGDDFEVVADHYIDRRREIGDVRYET